MAERGRRQRDRADNEDTLTTRQNTEPAGAARARRGGRPPDQPPAAQHLDRTERADRAFDLFCRGHTPTEIARHLDVSWSTAARDIRSHLRRLDLDLSVSQRLRLARAIGAQQAIARAAWARLEREAELEEAWLRGELDRVRRRILRSGTDGAAERGHLSSGASDPLRAAADRNDNAGGHDGDGIVIAQEFITPRLYFHQAHLLSVVLAAEREIARLQGLYDLTDVSGAAVHVFVSRQQDDAERPWVTTENGLPIAAPAESSRDAP
jgi:DNA-binding CsgD family transcriptional regulator